MYTKTTRVSRYLLERILLAVVALVTSMGMLFTIPAAQSSAAPSTTYIQGPSGNTDCDFSHPASINWQAGNCTPKEFFKSGDITPACAKAIFDGATSGFVTVPGFTKTMTMSVFIALMTKTALNATLGFFTSLAGGAFFGTFNDACAGQATAR